MIPVIKRRYQQLYGLWNELTIIFLLYWSKKHFAPGEDDHCYTALALSGSQSYEVYAKTAGLHEI